MYNDGLRPHLCVLAIRNIPVGVELRYNYEDSHNLTWRRNVSMISFYLFSFYFINCIQLQLLLCFGEGLTPLNQSTMH